MRNVFKFGFISFAFAAGFVFVTADSVNAQSTRREARREYRQEVRGARREYRSDVRRGENRREARREYRDDVRDARRDYRGDIRDIRRNRSNRGLHRGWTIGRGNAYGRRNNPNYSNSSRYYYRNGRLYRRW
jgi:hypothetical protein